MILNEYKDRPISIMNLNKNHFSFLRFCLFAAILVFSESIVAQNQLTAPFNNGFVGSYDGNNAATNCYYLSASYNTDPGLGWSNIQFTQNSPNSVFVAQGNDIIGSVLITDFAGVEFTIPGFFKWRAPSGSPSTLVFQPSGTVSYVLATNGANGSNTYTITNGSSTNSNNTYIGLRFNSGYNYLDPTTPPIAFSGATNDVNKMLPRIPKCSHF